MAEELLGGGAVSGRRVEVPRVEVRGLCIGLVPDGPRRRGELGAAAEAAAAAQASPPPTEHEGSANEGEVRW